MAQPLFAKHYDKRGQRRHQETDTQNLWGCFTSSGKPLQEGGMTGTSSKDMDWLGGGSLGGRLSTFCRILVRTSIDSDEKGGADHRE